MTRFLEAEGTILTEQLSEALSADSFSAASLEKQFSTLHQNQTFWGSSLQEKGALCGAEEHELGTPGLEEGPLQRLGEAGK